MDFSDVPLYLSHSHFMKKLEEENRFENNRYEVALRLKELQFTLRHENHKKNQISLESATCVPYQEELLPSWNAFADSQKNNKSLTSIKIKKIYLPPSPFFKDKLYPILKKNKNLTSLELIGVNLPLILGVARALKKKKCCNKLVALDLSSNKINDVAHYQLLSEAIGNHHSLSYVNLSNNKLGKNVDHLSVVLKGSGNLESLILDSNFIDSDGIDLVIDFLKSNKTLTTLSLGDNIFGAKGLKALATTFESVKDDDMALRELNLSRNRLTLSAKVESKVLCDKLTHIDLSYNQIKMPGVRNIVAYLENNPALSCLNLAGNRMRNAAAVLLMGVLKRNTNLAHLNLRQNSFSKASVPCIVDALKNNSTLLTFDLSDNNIKPKSGGRKELVTNALYDCTSLQSIIDSNHSCQVYLSDNNWGNRETHEVEIRKMNAFGNEGKTIRYKLVLAMFTLKTIPFSPHGFQHIPLELMPRLLELVQQEMGHKGFGKNVWKASKKGQGSRCLTRVYGVMSSWSMLPSLFERGPGKVKTKKVTKKRKRADDEDWTAEG